MNKKNISLSVLMLLFSFSLFAQTASIKGVVLDKETNEPIMFTNVYLYKTSYGAATDINGFYNITKIPAGNYFLMVTSLGYDTLKYQIALKAGDFITKNLFLSRSSIMLETVNISGESTSLRNETRTSMVQISPNQIQQIPSIGGQADIAQYLQVIPGVVFTGDQGGQLYIRGGSPVHNKVLLDGMQVFSPFHSIGLFSVFDTDILKNIDMFTGGFNAQYGGRVSSIMDITTRDGNKKRYGGKIDINTFGSKLIFEGPIAKPDKDEVSSVSFLLSGKTSYLDRSAPIFYSYIDSNNLDFTYNDFYGKISVASNNGSKVNVFGFHFDDKVNYDTITSFDWVSNGGGSNIVLIPEKSDLVIRANFAYYQYKTNYYEATSEPRYSAINGFNGGLSFVYFLGKNEIDYGLEMSGFSTDFKYYNSSKEIIQQEENTTEIASFVKVKKMFNNLIVEPGVRLTSYFSKSIITLEPRLAAKYLITDWLRVKAAAGLYSQDLIGTTSEKEVVNLFNGYIAAPESVPNFINSDKEQDALQRAQHLISGIEIEPFPHTLFNLEHYFKYFSQLTNFNRYKQFTNTDEYASEPEYKKVNYISEKGKAIGFDVNIKYDYRKYYFWAAYSYSYITKNDGLSIYHPHFDRRHNANIIGIFRFGKNFCWEASARWNLGSGFPFTQTAGYFERYQYRDLWDKFYNENGQFTIIFGDYNKGRFPYYHRLDIAIKRKIKIAKHMNMELNAGATNLYNRENIFYVNRVSQKKIYQLPFMYNFGMSLTF